MMPMPTRAMTTSKFISLPEAIGAIAFRRFTSPADLTAAIDADPEKVRPLLEAAAQQFTALSSSERLTVRGRWVREFRSVHEAALANTETITASGLRDYSQIDLDVVGLRKRPHGQPNILWKDHPDMFAREFAANAALVGGASEGGADGFREVEILSTDLERELRSTPEMTAKENRGGRPREIDRDMVLDRARMIRAEYPQVSKASLAASIAAELPANPRTGKQRDARGIEKLIAQLWGEE